MSLIDADQLNETQQAAWDRIPEEQRDAAEAYALDWLNNEYPNSDLVDHVAALLSIEPTRSQRYRCDQWALARARIGVFLPRNTVVQVIEQLLAE